MDDDKQHAEQESKPAPQVAEEHTGLTYIGPQTRPSGDGFSWITAGWQLFRKSPGPWIITMIVGALIVIVLNFMPVIGQVFMWLTTYVWIGGLMIGCQASYQGQPFDVKYLFDGFKHRVGSLIGLSVLVSGISILLSLIVMGDVYLELISGDVEGSNYNPMEVMLSALIVMALTIPLYMAVWFAPALIVLQDMPLLEAMKQSFNGCLKNVYPFLLYGIAMLVLLILAALPMMLGLLILMPVLYTSMYCAYQRIYLLPG